MNEIFCSNSPNIMYILTANQNARVIVIIYYAHIDWLNLCAHETTTKRAFGLLSIGKNGTIGRRISFKVLLMVPMLPT